MMCAADNKAIIALFSWDAGARRGRDGEILAPVADLAGLLVIEYFHCQSNKSAVITAEMLTKEMPSCKQHAEHSSFDVKYAIIRKAPLFASDEFFFLLFF